MSDSRFHRLTVADVIAESDDACSFVFDVPAALRDAFAYRPGQFLTLNVPCASTMMSISGPMASRAALTRATEFAVVASAIPTRILTARKSPRST